jgi:sugar lactone lactonase YvrE
MNAKSLNALLIALVICFGWSIAWSAQSPFPVNATFTTRHLTPFAIEGLTMDATGNFYTTGRQPDTNKKCPVWRISANGATRVSVGFIPNSPCNPLGIAFDSIGNLYIADAASPGNIWKVSPNPTGCASDDSTSSVCTAIANSTSSSPTNPFASSVPGTNGVAFDKDGNLWTGDGGTGGGTGFGRVWKITGRGADCATEHLCQEVFRIQPMNNGSTFGGAVPLNPGVGRVNATMQPNGTPANNPQNLVVNGLAFNAQGNLLVADTARGALWLVTFDKSGNLVSKLGCDATFSSNTLCLENLFRADPRLEGVDGIALDISGDIWASVNERNAIVFTVFFGTSDSFEVFRNPVNSSGLRNSATNTADNNRILEFPTSPFLSGTKFCTANSDNNRRDNSPNDGGEVKPAGPSRGKISCMDQDLTSPGLPLPR